MNDKQDRFDIGVCLMGGTRINMQKKKFLGSDFTVVPSTIIKEGAFFPESTPRELGAVFIGSEAIRSSVKDWEGRGVSLNHPDNALGTLNTPEAFDDHFLGFVFNSKYDETEKAIKAEFWLWDDKAENIISTIRSGKAVDVSIGGMANYTKVKGTINNIEYGLSLSDIKPDHVAILPDSKGACSYEQGCGIRAKSSEQENEVFNGDSEKMGEKTTAVAEKNCVELRVTAGAQETTATNSNVPSNVDDLDFLLAMASPRLKKEVEERVNIADKVRAEYIDIINAAEGMGFCSSFLGSSSIKNLKSLAAMATKISDADKLAEASKVTVAAEEPATEEKIVAGKADFSLNSPSHAARKEETSGFSEIEDIDLG